MGDDFTAHHQAMEGVLRSDHRAMDDGLVGEVDDLLGAVRRGNRDRLCRRVDFLTVPLITVPCAASTSTDVAIVMTLPTRNLCIESP